MFTVYWICSCQVTCLHWEWETPKKGVIKTGVMQCLHINDTYSPKIPADKNTWSFWGMGTFKRLDSLGVAHMVRNSALYSSSYQKTSIVIISPILINNSWLACDLWGALVSSKKSTSAAQIWVLLESPSLPCDSAFSRAAKGWSKLLNHTWSWASPAGQHCRDPNYSKRRNIRIG